MIFGILAGVALLLGLGGGFLLKRWISLGKERSQKERVRMLLEEAEGKARTLEKEAELSAKSLVLKARLEVEEEVKKRTDSFRARENELHSREIQSQRWVEEAKRKTDEVRRLEQGLSDRARNLEKMEEQCQTLTTQVRGTLEKLAHVSSEEARKILMEELTAEVQHEAGKKARQIEEEVKGNAEKQAKKIIGLAVERLAGDWVQEATVATVKLPSEDMKGRIIGREGRNIRALEALTGVDLMMDDTPGTVVLSSHNPVRREIARVALERLLQDGRIHPGRIEEILKKVTEEVQKGIKETGEQALFEMDIHGIHPELVRLLGSLKYRYSYAQNVLNHSIEVGFLCGIMAAELGLNQKIARRAGLLHDIGKALSHEVEGSHAVIGGELVKKYGESAEVVHGVWAHHEDIPQESVLDYLVDAADALSGARPGARMEQAEACVKRLEDLERIASSFQDVGKAYAIQAGRELRVMVQPERISDDGAFWLCRDIAKRIEKELTYPGQIKVVVIRETRAVDFAK